MAHKGTSEIKKSKPSASQPSKSKSQKAKGSGRVGARKPSVSPGKAGAAPFEPGLYVVATPIGHARDITLRALDLLGAANVIACEDTRVTAKLLARHGIRASLLPYHDHNAEAQRPKIIRSLKEGETVALVTDAGTPLISDPGFTLIGAARDAGVYVTALPGASSVLNGLVLAGLPTDRFFFQGFLPTKPGARARALAAIVRVPATLIFLESSKRLAASLADMTAVLGPRPAAVMREMTKMFEETRRGDLPGLAAHYAGAGPPRGEVVICVGAPDADSAPDADTLRAMVADALSTMSVRDAAAHVADEAGVPKKEIYALALQLSKDSET